ncbi:AAA family ATPase [Novosphingobium cyanobacteriorum]|uniref:AAA family ATPase n=1 Tax=Novosphingobium cyanobacteriorum TaxID=3024215 RepID=A0ABT6CME4_9SPHN|nr:AAA family ATPase [Novosphingobium cyanobacteriorum]MDF8335091.1 AAA family ATPase [Novosphingobium cyanobacteriorum]
MTSTAYSGRDFADLADAQIAQFFGDAEECSGQDDAPLIKAAPYSWPDPASIPRRQWLLGRWLLRGEVTAIFAPGGVGKSTLSTAIAISLASGRDLLNQPPKGQVGAWIYNLEDAPEELDRQIAATLLLHGVDREECDGRLFVNSGITMPLCTASEEEGGPTINEAAFVQLKTTILREGIGVVVIDPLVSSHRVTEASNEAIDAIAKRWKRLAHETGCAVILVHHTRKLMGREATAEDGRGAVALRDAARVVLVLNKVSASEAESLGLTDPKIYRSLVKVDMGKASRAPDETTTWLKLEGQSLGNGDDLEPPDFVGVATLFDKPDVFDGMTTWHLYRVQQRLEERDWRDSVQAKDWIGKLVAEVTGLDASKKSKDIGRIKAIVKEWKRTGALVVDHRTDDNGDTRPCIAIGKVVDPSECGSPHLESKGAEGAESAVA